MRPNRVSGKCRRKKEEECSWVSWGCSKLKRLRKVCPEMSVAKCQTTVRKKKYPEERRSDLHRGGSLKSRKEFNNLFKPWGESEHEGNLWPNSIRIFRIKKNLWRYSTIKSQRLYSQLDSSIEAAPQSSSNKTYSMYLICAYTYIYIYMHIYAYMYVYISVKRS